MKVTYIIQSNDNFANVKEVLKTEFELSDRLLLKLKKSEKIFLNHKPCFVWSKIEIGDILEIFIDFEETSNNIIPTKMTLDILYEDESYLVINKPAGIPVHPSMEHYEDSLSNGIKYYFDSISLRKKIRPVNRIDRNTSGIVIFAKNEYIQECLVKQMKKNIFEKEYIAICKGIFKEKTGIIDLPIARKENSIIERCVNKELGKPSITHYEVLEEFPKQNYSVIRCKLETGRTHQIRVHMQEVRSFFTGGYFIWYFFPIY